MAPPRGAARSAIKDIFPVAPTPSSGEVLATSGLINPTITDYSIYRDYVAMTFPSP